MDDAFVICRIDQNVSVAQNEWRRFNEIAREIDYSPRSVLNVLSHVLDVNLVAGAIPKKILHRIGAVAHDDKKLAQVRIAQSFHDMLQNRPATDFEHRLG
jgi:hypothetical protein